MYCEALKKDIPLAVCLEHGCEHRMACKIYLKAPSFTRRACGIYRGVDTRRRRRLLGRQGCADVA